MCVSMIGQLMFAIIMFITFVLTIIAFTTPGWKSFTVIKGHESTAEKYLLPETMGLLWCTSPTIGKTSKIDYCNLWQNNKPSYEKDVTVLMIATLILEVGALIWISVTFCACCCREFWILFLPLSAFLATLTLGFSLLIYTNNNENSFDILAESKDIVSGAYHVDFSYSYYLAWIALFLAVICILVGTFAKKLAQICC